MKKTATVKIGILLSGAVLSTMISSKQAQAAETTEAAEPIADALSQNQPTMETITQTNEDGTTTTHYQTTNETEVPNTVKENPQDYSYTETTLPGEEHTAANKAEIPEQAAVTEEKITGETIYTTDAQEAYQHSNVTEEGQVTAASTTSGAVEVADGSLQTGIKPGALSGQQLDARQIAAEDNLTQEEYEAKKAHYEAQGYTVVETKPTQEQTYGNWSAPIDGTTSPEQLADGTGEQLEDKKEDLVSAAKPDEEDSSISEVAQHYVAPETENSITHYAGEDAISEEAKEAAVEIYQAVLNEDTFDKITEDLQAQGLSTTEIQEILDTAEAYEITLSENTSEAEVKTLIEKATKAQQPNQTDNEILAAIYQELAAKLSSLKKQQTSIAEQNTSLSQKTVISFIQSEDYQISSPDLSNYGYYTTVGELQQGIAEALKAKYQFSDEETAVVLTTFAQEIQDAFEQQTTSVPQATSEADQAIADFLASYAIDELQDSSGIYISQKDLLDNLLKAASEFHIFTKDFTANTSHINGNVAAEVVKSLPTNIGLNNFQQIPGVVEEFYFGELNGSTATRLVDNAKVHIGTDNTVQTGNDQQEINQTALYTNGEVIQDEKGTAFINFDTELTYYQQLSDVIAGFSNTKGVAVANSGNEVNIDISEADGNYVVVNLSEEDLNNHTIHIQGLTRGQDGSTSQALLLNIIDTNQDGSIATNTTKVNFTYTDGTTYGTDAQHGEQTDFSGAVVLWNFNRAANVTNNYGHIYGQILAPTAAVLFDSGSDLDGNIIAAKVVDNQETHRWDFQEAAPETETPAFSIGFSKAKTQIALASGLRSNLDYKFHIVKVYAWGTNYSYTKTTPQYRTRSVARNFALKVYEQRWQPTKWVATLYSYRDDTVLYHYHTDTQIMSWEITATPAPQDPGESLVPNEPETPNELRKPRTPKEPKTPEEPNVPELPKKPEQTLTPVKLAAAAVPTVQTTTPLMQTGEKSQTNLTIAGVLAYLIGGLGLWFRKKADR